MSKTKTASTINTENKVYKSRKISYDPLWKKLIDLKMTKTQLADKTGISRTTFSKMGKNGYVALEVIEKICQELDCDIVDVVSILPTHN